MFDARALALELLTDVLRQGRTLEEAFARATGAAELAPRDRAFARLLSATVLRRLPEIDAALARCLERPLDAKLARIQDVLRLSAAQLLHLGTPAHAAVSTGVALAGTIAAGKLKPLVNAVLRRLSREGQALPTEEAAKVNTPPWLWQAWCQAYGEERTLALGAAHLLDPPLDLSVKSDAGLWAEKLGATLLPTGSLRLPAGSGDITKLPGFTEGAWWVQDAAAALPAKLLAPQPGQRLLDLCAAPGGKTAQLAAAGARVTALDKDAARLGLVAQNLQRLSLTAELIAADATRWLAPEPFDGVLLDAPCSATGTLRRHPDLARRKSADWLGPLLPLQAKLLAQAARLLKPSACLVYAVCSLLPEEGPQQVAKLLAQTPDLRREPISAAEVGGFTQAITADGDLRTLPSESPAEGGWDGFYVARLRRLP